MDLCYRTDTAAFSSLIANMQIIPVFGTSFTVYVPIIMSIIAIITLIDGFSRLLKLLGIETEDSLTSTAVCGFFRQDSDMDTELLEKCKSGQMIIANELRQLDIAQEALRKNRAAFESKAPAPHSSSTTAKNNNSSSSSSNSNPPSSATGSGLLGTFKDSVVAKVAALGGAKYSNLEATEPRSMLEDEDESGVENDDDDDQQWSRSANGRSSFHGTSIAKSYADRDNDLGESIFTSTLSGNMANSNPNMTKKTFSSFNTTKPTTLTSTSSNNHATKQNAVGTTSKPVSASKGVVPKKNFFDFDDDPNEDDDNNVYRGRYSDV
jgi:hypothetical protein